jgi:hypothetical protein
MVFSPQATPSKSVVVRCRRAAPVMLLQPAEAAIPPGTWGDVQQSAWFPKHHAMPHPSRYYDCLPGADLNDVFSSIFLEYDVNVP